MKDGTVLRFTRESDGALCVALAGTYGDGVRWIGDRLRDASAFWRGEPVSWAAFDEVAEGLPYWPEPGVLLPDMGVAA